MRADLVLLLLTQRTDQEVMLREDVVVLGLLNLISQSNIRGTPGTPLTRILVPFGK